MQEFHKTGEFGNRDAKNTLIVHILFMLASYALYILCYYKLISSFT